MTDRNHNSNQAASRKDDAPAQEKEAMDNDTSIKGDLEPVSNLVEGTNEASGSTLKENQDYTKLNLINDDDENT